MKCLYYWYIKFSLEKKRPNKYPRAEAPCGVWNFFGLCLRAKRFFVCVVFFSRLHLVPFILTLFWSRSPLWCVNERWQWTHGENKADEMQRSVIYAESGWKVYFILPWFLSNNQLWGKICQYLSLIFLNSVFFLPFSPSSVKRNFFLKFDFRAWMMIAATREMFIPNCTLNGSFLRFSFGGEEFWSRSSFLQPLDEIPAAQGEMHIAMDI